MGMAFELPCSETYWATVPDVCSRSWYVVLSTVCVWQCAKLSELIVSSLNGCSTEASWWRSLEGWQACTGWRCRVSCNKLLYHPPILSLSLVTPQWYHSSNIHTPKTHTPTPNYTCTHATFTCSLLTHTVTTRTHAHTCTCTTCHLNMNTHIHSHV